MRCKAKTKNGKQCRTAALDNDEYCFTHSPKVASERAAAHKKGGQAQGIKHNLKGIKLPEKIRTLNDVFELLDYIVAELGMHDNTIATNRAFAKVLDSAARLVSVGELEERIKALEALNKDKTK